MEWSSRGRASGASRRLGLGPRAMLAAACALALAGCTVEGRPDASAAQPRGASVAFESIDGPPPEQFRKLVNNLNTEAQSRRLAVMSRETPSAYRVRGYVAAKVVKGRTTISWVWDVFDGDERRALRIDGEEAANGRYRDAWDAADDAMLERIARNSMMQLAAFLTSPEVAPATSEAAGDARVALAGTPDSSPEAAGIFRIFQANADPAPPAVAPAVESEPVSVPLPRRRPAPAAVSADERLTLAASAR